MMSSASQKPPRSDVPASYNAPSSDLPMCDRVQAMLKAHARFEKLMAEHQIALVDRAMDIAKTRFDRLRVEKLEHMLDEERTLIPAYAELGEWERGGDPELFLAEHRKIYAMANQVASSLDDLDRGRLTGIAIVQIIDAEKAFKGVIEHHHLREQIHLFPRLTQ